jgi:molybdopterin-binding protein
MVRAWEGRARESLQKRYLEAAAITASSVRRLALKDGDQVTVIIKSTEVLIGK